VRQLQKPAVRSVREHCLSFGLRLRKPEFAVAGFKVRRFYVVRAQDDFWSMRLFPESLRHGPSGPRLGLVDIESYCQ
jgi:hypothetical protein